ncbi:MAG TPA: porin family protein [Puia sp.]
MKKTLLFAIGIAIASLSQAQTSKPEATKPPITFGVKGGFNLTGVKGKDVEGTSALPGFHLGVLAQVPLKNEFSLQPELFYSAEGSKMKTVMQGDGDEILEVDAKAHLNYLNLPVLLNYQHASGFFAQSGPQLGYLLSGKLKANGTSTDVKDEFKKTSLSWVVGVGYYLADQKIGFNLRYNFGFTKLGKAADGEPSAKAYGRAIQAGVFYMF